MSTAPPFDPLLLARIEDASLNASAPPQQRWLDGWLIRFSPGKAKRARCINAMAAGRLALEQKLALAAAVYAEAGLPMILRTTPFSVPRDLDSQLEARGWKGFDSTRVMVCTALDSLTDERLPRGLSWHLLGHHAFAQAVGQLRGSPLAQRQAHAARQTLAGQ